MDVERQYRPEYEAQTISDLYKILPDQTQLSPTEKRNPNSMNLASSTVNEICQLQLDDTLQAIQCLGLYLTAIGKLIQDVIGCLKNGGKLYYVGAGSSGRIALLDSLECPPTFGSHKIESKFWRALIIKNLRATKNTTHTREPMAFVINLSKGKSIANEM